MLKSKELRVKAWSSLKGKYWRAFLVVLVLGLFASIGTSLQTGSQSLTDLVNMVDPSEMDATMEMGAAVVGTAASVMGIVGMGLIVLGSDVTVEAGAIVEDSVLLNGVTVKAGAQVRYAILDSNVIVGEKAVVGEPKNTAADVAVVGAKHCVAEGEIVPAGAMISDN